MDENKQEESRTPNTSVHPVSNPIDDIMNGLRIITREGKPRLNDAGSYPYHAFQRTSAWEEKQ